MNYSAVSSFFSHGANGGSKIFFWMVQAIIKRRSYIIKLKILRSYIKDFLNLTDVTASTCQHLALEGLFDFDMEMGNKEF